MARPSWCVLLLVLLVSSALCAAHTPTALLKKSVKSVAKRSKQASKAGGAALKAGAKVVQATGNLSKQAAGTAAAGLKAGKVAVEAASSSARRVSQRTWEAAKVAREAAKAAKAAYVDTLESVSLSQQQLQQEAQQLTEAVFPGAPGTPPSSPAAAAAAAGGGGTTAARQLQQECDLEANGFCIVEKPAATKASPAASASKQQQEVCQAAAARTPAQMPAVPHSTGAAADGDTPAAAAAGPQEAAGGGWLLWTHLAAVCLGWWLRGKLTRSHQARAQRQQKQQQSKPAQPPATAANTSQQQQQQQQRPASGGAAASSSSSSSNAQPTPAPAASEGEGSSKTAAVQGQRGAAAPAGEQQHGLGSRAADPCRNQVPAAADSAVGEKTATAETQEAAAAAAEAEEVVDSDTGSFVVCDSNEDGSSSSAAAADGANRSSTDAAAAAAAAVAEAFGSNGSTTGVPAAAAADDIIDLDADVAQQLPAPLDNTSAVLVAGPLQPQQVAGLGQVPPPPQGYQLAGTIINVNIGGKELANVLAPIAHQFKEVGDSLRHIAEFSQRWVRRTAQQDAAQRLAAQQQLLDSAGHFGQLLCLVVMGLVALRAGRLAQVHQMCQISMQQTGGGWGWAHRLAGTQFIPSGLAYLNCCSQNLGLHFAGMFALYMLARACWSGAPSFRRGAGGGGAGQPSNFFQLDLLVVKGVVCSWLGAHVVYCLGGAWLPWLVGWLSWCGMQLWLNVRLVGQVQSGVSVLLVAVVLPVAMALGPFRPEARLVQAHLLEAVPVLRPLWLSLGHLLPWPL